MFTMAGVQVRSEWLGFAVAFAVWSFLAKKMSRFFAIIGMTVLLTAIGLFFDLRMEGALDAGVTLV